jgi:hypothetical protein
MNSVIEVKSMHRERERERRERQKMKKTINQVTASTITGGYNLWERRQLLLINNTKRVGKIITLHLFNL